MFDNQTIAFLTMPGMVAALLAQLVNWASHRDTPGVKWWTIGMALETAGVILRAQLNLAPEWAIIPSVNLLLIGGQFVVLYGLCAFAGRPMFTKTAILTVATLPLAQLCAAFVADTLLIHTALIVIGLGMAFGLQLSLLRTLAKRDGLAGVLMLIVAYGLTFTAFVIRLAVIAVWGPVPVGMLHLNDSMTIQSYQALASMVVVAMATAHSYGFIMLVASRARGQLRQVATVDALTGVPNRRAFDAELQHQISRARRSQGRLGLALMDLDRFKQVNDSHGHAAGDMLLRHFAVVVRGTLRESDFFARIGGEEFALLLADSSLGALHLAAERIRQALETQPLVRADGETLRATVSIGAATSAAGGGEMEPLYKAADAALYRAKSQGRNRVELAAEPAGPTRHAAANDSAADGGSAPAAGPAAGALSKPHIYTIGKEDDYDAALAREVPTPITKRGPYLQSDGSPYYGGYAFETVADAQAYIDKLGKRGEYAIYEIEASWPADVWHPLAVEDFMRLNRDAVLVRKIILGAPAPLPAAGVSS